MLSTSRLQCRDPLCTNCTGPGGSKCLACQSDAPVFSSGPSSVPSFDLSPVPFAPAPAPGGSADFARVYLDAQGVCTICPPGYNKGPCAPECTRGQYRDPATGLCRNCPRLCASCRLEKGRPVCTVVSSETAAGTDIPAAGIKAAWAVAAPEGWRCRSSHVVHPLDLLATWALSLLIYHFCSARNSAPTSTSETSCSLCIAIGRASALR